MALPNFRLNGTLPPGIHQATWHEVAGRLGKSSKKRRQQMMGLLKMCRHLESVGATHIWLDGSFVTSKPLPGDFDICYPSHLVDPVRLDARIQAQDSEAMKREYQGEAYADDHPSRLPGKTILEMFQVITGTNEPKGIVLISLDTLP